MEEISICGVRKICKWSKSFLYPITVFSDNPRTADKYDKNSSIKSFNIIIILSENNQQICLKITLSNQASFSIFQSLFSSQNKVHFSFLH